MATYPGTRVRKVTPCKYTSRYLGTYYYLPTYLPACLDK